MNLSLTLTQIGYVGAGGFLGAVLRYLVSGWTQNLWRFGGFPIGTIMVNMIGCLVLGFLAGWSEQVQGFAPPVRLFLLVGVLGSFTTFSTFGYETLSLMRDGEFGLGLLNGFGQLFVGVGLAWVGYSASELL